MANFKNWSASKKATLIALWLFATLGRVAYVSMDIPGEAISMFAITAGVLAVLGLALRGFVFRAQPVQAR